jgi:hypothetical protein
VAITSIKTGSSFTNLVKYNDFLAGNPAFSPSSYESIASATGTGSSGTITFSSIPATYKHLQIRLIARSSESAAQTNYEMQINGDTGSNYARHNLRAVGASVASSGVASQTSIAVCAMAAANSPANTVSPKIIDIVDYASTTKYKTVRIVEGQVNATYGGQVHYRSGLWQNTAAITSITLFVTGYNFTTQSSFALYGIKG